LISVLFFLQKYFFLSPIQTSVKMNYGWKQTAEIIKNANQVERVIISRGLSEPQAFIMFYLFPYPREVQAQTEDWLRYKQEGKNFIDQIGTYRLGKFTFRNFSFPEDWAEERTLLVGTESDFSVVKEEINLLKQPRTVKDEKGKNTQLPPIIKEEKDIYYPSDKIAFKIIRL